MVKDYFDKYLKIAPFSHALWRSVEAQAIADGYALIKKKAFRDKSPQPEFTKPELDIGCGFGEFAGVFFDRVVEVGIDISLDDLVKAKKVNKYKQLIPADARNMPFTSNHFATVLSVSVLEHIPSPEAVIKEAYRVLKPKGIFIFTVPTADINDHLFYPRILSFLGVKKLRQFYIDTYHRIFRHVNILSTQEWEKMTQAAGFSILLSRGMFSSRLVRVYDFFLMTALPSQILRWSLGVRGIWGLGWKRVLFNRLLQFVFADTHMTQSNIIIIAQKK